MARRVATAVLRSSAVNCAVRAIARLRGHQLVLVYHRLGPVLASEYEIVPTVPVDVFRAHLQALGEVVDLVALDEVVARSGGSRRRPTVAVTFDDDLLSHVEHALPVLQQSRVRAAFFLSGRALHGCGPYWFQQLEALLSTYGAARTATLLAVPDAPATILATVCEQRADVRRRVNELAAQLPQPDMLGPSAIHALGAAGMTVGFHTVDHDQMLSLDDPALADAVCRGRNELAAAAGTSVNYFAYPHGKADVRAAAAVRRAGYAAAFTGNARPIRRGDDPHCYGRWEPGPLTVDDLLVNLAVRLHRASPGGSRPLESWTSAS